MDGDARDGSGPNRLLNRELSWLDFNARVLALAEDAERPLLERAKFLAIFSTNLDEFVQVRVSGLQEQVAAGIRAKTPDGMDSLEQLRAIGARIDELVTRQAGLFTKEIAPALEDVGIAFSNWEELDDDDREYLVEVFEARVFPVLTPLAVDPAHPFPYISNLSLNLAVVVCDPETREQRFARVKVPPLLPRFIVMPDGERFVSLEQVIAAHLDGLFPGMEIIANHPFRVTRDADFELEDEDADLLEAIESVLTLRKRSGHVVRLEVDTHMSEEVLELLCRELELSEHDVNVVDAPLDLSGLWALYALDRPELKDPPWQPQTQPVLTRTDPPPDLFRLLQAGDVLVHHPYDSFTTSVEAFVDQASRDPSVLAIKQTLYRTAGPEGAIVASLVRAADAGKQVVALVELKARFDEQANVERARELEEAGVHVVYGLVGLKTHTKILLVVRQEHDGIRRYCHIGTGNYNPVTASLYEDIGLLTADPALGADLTELFNYLTGYSRQGQYRKLLVAPVSLRPGICGRIERETAKGAEGRIVLKMNSLVDPEIIEALYTASDAGVSIDLIVRGICCLRPGVPGMSENIRVRSIVGRFLEHSRIYHFGADLETAEYLIGSADLMPRNLDRRVEAVTPVTSAPLRARLQEILTTNLTDDVLAWELRKDGTWEKVPTVVGVDTHVRLGELAETREREEMGVPPMPEREVKLTPASGFRIPSFVDVVEGVTPGTPEILDLEAVYYDTEDLRLARSGASLRFRSPEAWTVKLPAPSEGALLVRGEYSFPGDPGTPPAAAVDLVRAWIRTAPVHAIARLKTRRRRIELTDAGGKKVAEVVDDEVFVLDGGRIVARFRELEVELSEDAPIELVDVLVARLQSAGAGAPDPTPKIVRALGMRAVAPPDVVPPADVTAASPARDVVRTAIASSVKRLLDHDPGVRLGDDPEQVHQARVATRRLRSDLRTFGSLLVPEWDESLREELKWLGAELGAVRDIEVLLDLLRRKVGRLNETDARIGEHLVARLVHSWEDARIELLQGMRSERYARLLERLVDAARQPELLPAADAPAAEVLPALAMRPWRQLRRDVRALPEVPEDEQLHTIRIRAKRARYAAEAVAPAVGRETRELGRAVAALQEVLGDHQDAVVASAWLRGVARTSESVDEVFVAGMLAGMLRRDERRTRAAWPAAWRAARRQHRLIEAPA